MNRLRDHRVQVKSKNCAYFLSSHFCENRFKILGRSYFCSRNLFIQIYKILIYQNDDMLYVDQCDQKRIVRRDMSPLFLLLDGMTFEGNTRKLSDIFRIQLV